jgi:hypothetical protein
MNVDKCVLALQRVYSAIDSHTIDNNNVSEAIKNLQTTSIAIMRSTSKWEKIFQTALCIAKASMPHVSTYKLAPHDTLHESLRSLETPELDKIIKSIFIHETNF